MAQVAGPHSELRSLWRSRLEHRARHIAGEDQPGVRRAAVAITVYAKSGSLHVLIIKRAARGSNAGQWALPGGRMDPGEDLVDTALRELHEETGIMASRTDVVGVLDDFPASRGIVITPVIVLLDEPQRPRRHPAEVASLHPLPLEALTADGVPRWHPRPDGGPILQMPLRRGMVIHAPTGAILWQFAEVVLRGRELRVSELAEPAFTAR
ncbi:CoA pyrophosphatase [Pseudarthrobacter sp. AL07]|uniref:NUDIX hydrolase n=1 Tax=Pseudarthrobacter sp. AL07 TaxID=3042233 RepID=UPI00249A094C|nr:CoA pyrophosphatase [Pseudarthrobacter sp. AL07]MDI3209316.1 CoA pyrophosphatase [Pseudarthrobacter sp. AL07]